MGLVGLSAAVVAYRKPELYRASSSQVQFAGVPLTTIAGVGSIVTGVFLWIVFLSEPKLGIADRSGFFVWAIGTVLAGAIFYGAAYSIRKGQGVNVNRAFAEIPPE
jgi:APA family basic amino acid/polyamine antiporter